MLFTKFVEMIENRKVKKEERVASGLHQATLKGCISQHYYPDLSDSEREVLRFLTEEFLTRKQIASRRKTSRQAVDKIINSLKKKGVISPQETKVAYLGGGRQPECNHRGVEKKRVFRLHGQHWGARFIYKSDKFLRNFGKIIVVEFDGCKVRINRDGVDIWVLRSFYGDDVDKATLDSLGFLQKVLFKIENDFGVVLVKDRCNNVKLHQQHYSEVGNELAKDERMSGDRFKVFGRDGKLWLLIDNSFNLHELETVHPEKAKEDMLCIQRHFEDIRNNDLPVLSDVMRVIKELAVQNKETASGLNAVASILACKSDDDGSVDDDGSDFRRYVG